MPRSDRGLWQYWHGKIAPGAIPHNCRSAGQLPTFLMLLWLKRAGWKAWLAQRPWRRFLPGLLPLRSLPAAAASCDHVYVTVCNRFNSEQESAVPSR